MKTPDIQDEIELKMLASNYRRGLISFDKLHSEVMERIRQNITAEAIEPMPEDCIKPDIHPGHFPNEYIIGWDIWENGVCMLSNNNEHARHSTLASYEPSKATILTDHNGLKTHLSSLSVQQAEEGITGCNLQEYRGMGTIEGYTSSREREIRIFVENDRIHCLIFFVDEEDARAHRCFPLWQKYNEYLRRIDAVQRKAASDMIKRL